MSRFIFWDFDGTLAYRKDMWRGALMDALDEEEPGHPFSANDLRHGLRDRFPWHRPERPHPELSDPEAWWGAVEPILAGTFEGLGFDKARARRLARNARMRYVDPQGYALFDDTIATLDALSGWRHVIVSNHVPELEAIVEGLGFRNYFHTVITSARIGFEKPHPRIYDLALEIAGKPHEVWMVGDNPEADVSGPEAAGIPAILVRTESTEAKRQSPDLMGVVGFVNRKA